MKKLSKKVMMLFFFGLAIGVSQAQGAFEKGISIQIPVIVNIYAGSGTTPAEAKAAIDEANKLMKQTGMKLVVVQTNNPPAGNGGDANGDGAFTGAERGDMRTFGGKELKKLKNEKGIKISFGNDPVAGTGSKGVSVHRNPTIMVRESTPAEGGAADTGQTIAHEIGHVMTLGPGHLVSKGPPAVNADAGGHSAGADDIMQETGKGDKFTEEQIKEMRSRRYHHGKCSVQWDKNYAAQKVKQQYGHSTDDRNDTNNNIPGSTPLHDIDHVILTSLAETDHLDGDYVNLDVQITLAGTLNDGEAFGGLYVLGFDGDNNPATGVPIGNQMGFDRIVEIDLLSEGVSGSTYITARVVDTQTGNQIPLCDTPQLLEDNEFDNGPDPDVASTSIILKVPKCLLDLQMPNVPAIVASFSASDPSIEIDQTEDLTFDQDRWDDDPDLQTHGDGVPYPGVPYQVDIAGLDPLSPYSLYLDDTEVANGVLGAAGEITVNIMLPPGVPNTESHFLTAQDQTGEFAYGMTCPRTVEGDLNNDNRVDLLDLGILSFNWLDGTVY